MGSPCTTCVDAERGEGEIAARDGARQGKEYNSAQREHSVPSLVFQPTVAWDLAAEDALLIVSRDGESDPACEGGEPATPAKPWGRHAESIGRDTGRGMGEGVDKRTGEGVVEELS
jgi:hypothetical protein